VPENDQSRTCRKTKVRGLRGFYFFILPSPFFIFFFLKESFTKGNRKKRRLRKMELNERINVLEGEVKLVKSEIKKVLVDLRETMNNLENPFVNIEQLKKSTPETEIREKEERIPLEEVDVVPKPEHEPEFEPEIAQVATATTTRRDRDGDREEMKKLAKITGEGAEKIDIFALTQLMKWADNSLSNIGKEKLDKILDLYDLTGRIPKETKDMISSIEALSDVNHAKEKEEIEMKDYILAIYQLDRILTGETQTQAPILLSSEELEKWLKV